MKESRFFMNILSFQVIPIIYKFVVQNQPNHEMRKLFGFLFVALSLTAYGYNGFSINRGKPVTFSMPGDCQPVLGSAVSLFDRDLRNVFSDSLMIVSGDDVDIRVCVEPDKVKDVQGYRMEVGKDGKLVITGHDSHGAAYGIMELSRLIGVSPWEWWADAVPEKRDTFELPAGYVNEHSPSVEYRGIFINDEDWGLMPWSSMTMEPGNRHGVIGPKTTEKIFELLLRLRANTYWPPMHECSEPFFLTPGNREVAERFGIYIGSSHCEPMASSAAVEWGCRGKGEYDYVNNSRNVLRFWEDRVRDVAGQEIIYTLGMRGVHDGAMNGAKTVDEQKDVLTKIFQDQRDLLSRHVDKDVTGIPQVFIPYKEVLDVYNAGLEVPEDVTLMWCDDNYGYIRHFPTEKERGRKGGNGVYYHVSYWGCPHDYLWLGTFSPYLLYQQMKEAYDRGIRKMWILNVGDIKPAEYQIELFMDMAWDMDAVGRNGVQGHMGSFMAREFGQDNAEALLPVMNEHYRLAFIRKPEFLGNTRCEEYGPGSEKWKVVTDLFWSDEYCSARINDYQRLADEEDKISRNICKDRLDTYYQLVGYPVQSAAQMNKKMLYGQLARHGKATWAGSRQALDSIISLTARYNKGIDNRGKWNGIMDWRPRRLSVFEPLDTLAVSEETKNPEYSIIRGESFVEGKPVYHYGLGHTGNAVGIKRGTSLVYDLGRLPADSVAVRLNFLPVHPVEKEEGLRFAVKVDDEMPQVFDFSAKVHSEEWKENVLNNRASRIAVFPITGRTKAHKLTVTALSEGIILDSIDIL